MSRPIGLLRYTMKDGLRMHAEASTIKKFEEMKPSEDGRPRTIVHFKDGCFDSSTDELADLTARYDQLVERSVRSGCDDKD